MHLSCNHSVLYSTGSLAEKSQLNELPVTRESYMTWMPFVNRFREVLELAVYIHCIRKEGAKKISDWRNFRFCFAAQMYGAGKT